MRSLYLLLFFLLLTIANQSKAQKTDWSWVSAPNLSSGNSPSKIVMNAAGDMYVVGTLNGTLAFDTTKLKLGNGRIYIVKYNKAGKVIWARQTGICDAINSVSFAIDTADNIYISGSFASSIRFGSTTLPFTGDVSDFFLAKLDKEGTPLWAKKAACQFGATVIGVCTDRIGNVCIVGLYGQSIVFGSTTLTQVNGGNNMFIVKYSAAGNVQWASRAICTSQENYITGILPADDGGFFVSGDYTGDMVFTSATRLTSNNRDVFLAKYDALGNIVWAKTIGGIYEEHAGGITKDKNGDLFVTGKYESPTVVIGATTLRNSGNEGYNMFFAKYRNNGTPLWAKSASCSWDDAATSVTTNSSGSIFVGGYTRAAVFRLGADSTNLSQDGSYNFFLAKYDSLGNPKWVKGNSNQGSSFISSIVADECDNVFAAGVYNKYLTLSPLPTYVTEDASGGTRTFVAMAGNIGANATQTICHNDKNASATVNITGFDPEPYTFAWSNGATTQTVDGLGTGVYTVTVTNGKGCTNKTVATVTSTSDIKIATVYSNASCSGVCTGSLTVTPSGGFAPYSYLWDESAGSSTMATAGPLCPAVYNVAITDSLGCKKTIPAKVAVGANIPRTGMLVTNLTSVDRGKLDTSVVKYYAYDVPGRIETNKDNPENFLNPGKYVRLKIRRTNKKTDGTLADTGRAIIRTNSPYITITDSIAGFTNMLFTDSSQWSDDEFEIRIDNKTPPGALAPIDIILTEGSMTHTNGCVSIPVMPMVLDTNSIVSEDNIGDSRGNANGWCETGETIEFGPLLNNESPLNAYDTKSTLRNPLWPSHLNIQNGNGGMCGVHDSTWFNNVYYINSGTTGTRLQSDYLFDYISADTLRNFVVYNQFISGFTLFPRSTVRSSFRWLAPFTFNKFTADTTTPPDTVIITAINIYPNPSKGKITIALPNQTPNNTIAILDLSGKMIFKEHFITNIIKLDMFIPKGMYFVVITEDGKNKGSVRKLVID